MAAHHRRSAERRSADVPRVLEVSVDHVRACICSEMSPEYVQDNQLRWQTDRWKTTCLCCSVLAGYFRRRFEGCLPDTWPGSP